MAFYIYILKCSDGTFYTGHTDNIENRLDLHSKGEACSYTQERLPVNLVFSQEFAPRYEALVAERKIKKWTKRKKEALVMGGWDALRNLTKKENKGR